MSYEAFGKDYSVKPVCSECSGQIKNILFVGNSFFFYNCGVNNFVAGLAKSKGIKAVMTLVGIGGASLYWHDVKSYLRPNGLRSYTIASDGTNKLEFINYPGGKIFDAVVLCDSSQGPIHPELSKVFSEAAAKACADVKAHGAQPLLYMTWAYRGRPEMTAQLADAITLEANRNQVPVSPSGLAFARSLALRPELELIRSDNRHPTVAGTYLQACVLFGSFWKQSAEGSDFLGRFEDMSVSPEEAKYLQAVAWETLCEYNGW